MRSRCASGSKPGETACSKRLEERGAIAAVPDVVAHGRRLARDRARRGSGRGPTCSACDAVACVSSCQYLPWMTDVKPSSRVALDVLPDVQHRAAGRVDQRAAALDERLQQFDGDAERRQDDDVVRRQRVERFAGIAEEADALRAQLIVDVRVVDDLAGQEDGAIGKARPRLVGVVDGAIDAVAEAELAREVQA